MQSQRVHREQIMHVDVSLISTHAKTRYQRNESLQESYHERSLCISDNRIVSLNIENPISVLILHVKNVGVFSQTGM